MPGAAAGPHATSRPVTYMTSMPASRPNPGALSEAPERHVGGALTTYATFLPCFMFIFLRIPYIERLSNNTGCRRH